MNLLGFLRTQARWLTTGFTLFLISSFGQTFFVSLSAEDIRRDFRLSHGEFGTLFTVATLLSALTLPRLGGLIDRRAARRVVAASVLMLGVGAALLASARHVAVLFVALFLLRLFGQGMMTHLGFTLIGRWFTHLRGRALALTTLGLNLGQALLPAAGIALAAMLGWRGNWWIVAAVLIVCVLPLLAATAATERAADTPSGGDATGQDTLRQWTRAEVLRDPAFYLLLLGMLPPALISNTLFFHQVLLVQIKGWSLTAFASSFSVLAASTILFSLIAGHLVDRWSATRLLWAYLLPFGAGCMLLAVAPGGWVPFVFMALFGITNGCSLALFGALWPEVYGTRHLGAIRSLVSACLVLASALGPGVSGRLIDAGIGLLPQLFVLGLCCVGVSALMWPTVRHVDGRRCALPSAGGVDPSDVQAPGTQTIAMLAHTPKLK
ncbi:MFS transporter [Roseateles chitinivorans]|uniref:MFS transporter n=1 Tax=Roseateles chitinivorans TaxID=2917965 RepID=UPI003D678174